MIESLLEFLRAIALPIGVPVGTAVGVKIAHAASRPRRRLRAARRAIGRLTRALRPIERAVARPLEQLRRSSASFVRRQRATDLAETPLASLRDVGVSHIRWSALEAAGLDTLGDLEGWTTRRLEGLEGIGGKSAREVLVGRRAMAQRIADEAPRPPTPELNTREEVDVARRCLVAMDALAALGSVEALGRARDELVVTRGRLAHETGCLRWLLGGFRASRRDAWCAAAEALGADAEALLRGESFQTLERTRQGFDARGGRRDADAVRREFASRYAEGCAVFERAHVGRLDSGLGSALSPDLLRRIRSQSLRLEGLGFTLRGYQQFGARFILAQGRTLLGDEMGLGKTVQALAAAVHLRNLDPAARIAVVMPASLLHQWARETREHSPLSVHVAHGDERDPSVVAWLAEGGVLAVSYATLRNLDLAARLREAGVGVDLVIADEAHYAKNPGAKRTQALAALLERSERRCLMTGTPLENHPDEFQRILSLIDPALEARTERGRHDRAAGFLAPEVFQQRVAEVYLRRTQKDVLTELPDRIDVEEWVELSPREREAYTGAVAEGNFMAMRRRATLGPEGASAKLDLLEELVLSHREEGRKVLVFSYFLEVLRAVSERLEPIGTIHGGVSPADRDRLIVRFREAPDGSILLGQIVAAGVGLNLQCASAVVLLEPQLKPALEAQAIARAHRMGQTRRLLVHRLFAEDTVDARLRERLAEKARLFERYAEGSLLEAASDEETETSLARTLVDEERARLGAGAGADS